MRDVFLVVKSKGEEPVWVEQAEFGTPENYEKWFVVARKMVRLSDPLPTSRA